MDGKRGEGWPGPEARARQRLPRVEDLPAAEHGYDREQVRAAFDAFYRHIAQLDATLRALEAVEVFRDQAGELRKELRALKAAGWAQQPWPTQRPARVSAGLPESLPRFAIEAAFLVIVAVVVAVSGFDRLSIVLVMALAWAIVGVVEWAASRERFARARLPAPGRAREETPPPAPLRVISAQPPASAPVESWSDPAAAEAQAEAAAEEEEEESTVVRAPDRELEPPEAVVDAPPPADEAEPEVEADAEPEMESLAAEEPEEERGRWSWAADAAVERARERAEEPPAPRRRWWRRDHEEDGLRFDPVQPRHVRVLPPEPSFDEQFPVEPKGQRLDPWEEELDISIEEPEGAVDGEPDREPAEVTPVPD